MPNHRAARLVDDHPIILTGLKLLLAERRAVTI